MDNELIDALPGLDKGSILFQILGESLALTMFQDISESDILRIRVRSKKELKNIPFKVKQSILEEFYFKLMTLKYRNINKDKKLFSFLDNLNDEQIYYLISTESAKVIALTLEISEDRKIKILNRFSNQVKHEIIMNFADLTDIPLEGIVNIAHELKKKNFISAIAKRIFGGPKSIATLLNQMSISEADQYLEQIAQDDPELYAEIKKYFLSFDDLVDMPDHLMSTFWKNLSWILMQWQEL